MRNLKSIIGIGLGIGGLIYCASLIHYFSGVAGAGDETQQALTPTLLGLTVVGGLISIPVIFKVIGLFTDLRPFGSGNDTPPDSGVDADAVIARYMAQQAAGGDVAPPRASFGRRAK